MTKYVRLNLFIIFTIFTSISLYSKEIYPPSYTQYVKEITNDFVKEMEKKYGLHCYGSGGSMPTDVEKIDVLFTSYRKLTVNDARKMEVDAIQRLLHYINTHKKIRPYLREYPFQTDRVGISISFRTKTDDRPLDGSIAYVSIGKNKIFYYTAEMKMSDPIPLAYMNEKNELVKKLIPGKLKEELIPIMNEPYEEALSIIEKSISSDSK